jgi:hypothetical protein
MLTKMAAALAGDPRVVPAVHPRGSICTGKRREAAQRGAGLPRDGAVRAGAREIVAWHDEDPSRQRIDPRLDTLMDRLVENVPGPPRPLRPSPEPVTAGSHTTEPAAQASAQASAITLKWYPHTVETCRFTLKPAGFVGGNPTLDVPSCPSGHHHGHMGDDYCG